MASSFKEMQKDGTIKRADKSLVRYEDIHVKPGFNLRDLEDPDFEADLLALEQHMAAGGKVPALEVVPCEGGGVELVDGHRRHIVYGRLIAKGHPFEWIHVEQFIGNDVHRKARILTSQEGRKLKPLEIAEGYRQLSAFGVSNEEIARMVHKSRQHVDQLMILSTAPHAVHQAVKAGEISATDATKLARKGDQAAAEGLAKGREAAKAAGKMKITAGVVKPWTPPAKVITPALNAIESFLESIPKGERVTITCADTGNDLVQVSAKELRDVFAAFADIEEARRANAEKQRGKAAKAAQMSVPGTDGA